LKFDFRSMLGQQQEHGARRSTLLRLAILGSGFSKLCGLALQAIAIPLVYHSLGERHYDLYLLLTGVLSAISLVQMGAGPGLTQGIAKANAAGRSEIAASLLRAAFRLAALAAVIGGTLIIVAVHWVPVDKLFGPAFSVDRNEILTDTNVCVALLALQVLAGVVDSALAGYQEQVFIHLGSSVANVLCIVLLYTVSHHAPTIIGIVLVLYGVPILPRLLNLVVLSRRRPYLLRVFFSSCRGSYSALLNVGMAFWAVEVGSVLTQNCGNYVLAHMSSVQATALFAVVYKTTALAGAVVSIVTMPLWPAFTDAIAHRDIEWIRRSYRAISRALTVYSCAVGLVMITAGQWIFSNLMHVDTTGSGPLFAIFGGYFVANVWTHLRYVTLMGMDNLWKVALVVLAENLLMLLFGMLLVPFWGATGMALAYLAASLALPVWLLPRLMQAAIRKTSDHAADTSPPVASDPTSLAQISRAPCDLRL
jgi:O-antigen/teichoic acid export membrane protein